MDRVTTQHGPTRTINRSGTIESSTFLRITLSIHIDGWSFVHAAVERRRRGSSRKGTDNIVVYSVIAVGEGGSSVFNVASRRRRLLVVDC